MTQALLIDDIRKGFSSDTLTKTATDLGITTSQLEQLLSISTRTMYRKAQSGGRLSLKDSDRVYRLQRIRDIAVEALGSIEKARIWLRTPSIALDNQPPLSLLDTEAGCIEVVNELRKIQYGMYL
jgi:putative toxin-antitoxin system antitoxin component (TIGR02293 family)